MNGSDRKPKDSRTYRQQAQEARELARRFDREDARSIFVELARLWSAMACRRAEDEALLSGLPVDEPGREGDETARQA